MWRRGGRTGAQARRWPVGCRPCHRRHRPHQEPARQCQIFYQTYVRCQVNLHAEEFTRPTPTATKAHHHTFFTARSQVHQANPPGSPTKAVLELLDVAFPTERESDWCVTTTS